MSWQQAWRRRDQGRVLLLDMRHMLGDWDSAGRRVAAQAAVRVLLHGRYRGLVWFRLSQLLPDALSAWCASRCLRACGAELHPRARIAGGLELTHSTGVVVGSEVVAGAGLTLFQGVTLGHGRDRGAGMPQLGRRVTVYAGASLLGPVRVGDDAVIGAGAVVLKDVPPGTTVTGTWR